MATRTGNGLFHYTGDSDWFRVRLVAGTTYDVSISGAPGGAILTVMLPHGQPLQQAIRFSNYANFVAPISGDYFVAMTKIDSVMSPVPYTISVIDIVDPIPASIATPESLAVGQTRTITNSTQGSRNSDWFGTDLIAGQSYVLNLSGSGSTYFTDSAGQLIAIERAGGVNGSGLSGQQVHFTPTASGHYFAGVERGTGGQYDLTLTAVADDHGDGPASAGAIALETTVNGIWEAGGDDDAYAVTLTAGNSYRFTLNNLTNSIRQGYIKVLDSSGGIVLDGSLQPGGVPPSVIFSPTTNATYYVVASFISIPNVSTPTDYLRGWNYALSASLLAGDQPDNALTQSTLAIGGQAAGQSQAIGDSDWFRLELTAGQSYTFTLTAPFNPVSPLSFALYDGQSRQIVSAGQTNTGSYLHHTATATGAYYLAAINAGSYTVAAAAVADDLPDNITTSGTVTVGGTAEGLLEANGDRDWFAVNLVAGRSYVAGVLESGGFAGAGIRDAQGNAISFLQSNGSQLATIKTSGTYYVEVTGTAGDYTFGITEVVVTDDFDNSVASTGVARILVNGTANNDVFSGTDEYERFVGGNGDDLYIGGSGFDQFEGGAGIDTVSYAAFGRGLTINLNLTRSQIDGVQYDALLAAENVIGSAFGDVIVGNFLANDLTGGGGDDFLDGSVGVDVLRGGTGNDVMVVDNSGDQAIELAGEGNDRVLARASYSLTPGAEIELAAAYDLAGTAALDLVGNEFGQVVIGNDGANRLYGLGGDDQLYGLVGNDFLDGGAGGERMYGGAGNDVLVVDDTGDQAIELAGEGNDRVLAQTSYALEAGSEVELIAAYDLAGTAYFYLFGNESGQVVIGNDGVNYLNGLGGDDTIYGLGGDDILVGGAGNDILDGGTGADQLQFNAALGAGHVDRILGFETGVDKLALDDAAFAGLTLGALSASAFVAGSAALDADDRIIYNAATGQLYFDADGNGAGAAIEFARLDPNTPLTASDFSVI